MRILFTMIFVFILTFLTLVISNSNINKVDVQLVSEIYLEPIYDNTYRTFKDVKYTIDKNDLTIPRFFKIELGYNHSKETIPSFILHDFLYKYPGFLTRKEVDDILYNSLINDSVSRVTSFRIYLLARLLGWRDFNGHDKA